MRHNATSPSLRICDDYQLELSDYARSGLRIGIWASSGRGKSFGVGVLCEELLDAGIPLIGIDPEGELHTLREQFRVLVLGGAHGDLALPAGGSGVRAALSRALEAGVGLVLDLSHLATAKAQQEAARPWLEQLWERVSERHALAALVVEEVHLFAPQSGSAVTAEIMQRFAKQGRKRGVILVAASQRTQAVSKEFMSQLNFPAIGGFETERDYNAVRAVVDGHPFEEFRSLAVGEFFLPAAGGFHRWRARRTSHGGDAPAWGMAEERTAMHRDATLDALLIELRQAFERDGRAGADPDAVLHARIRELEDNLQGTRRALLDAQAEVKRLSLALQVAGVVKVVIRQEMVAQGKEPTAAPASDTPAPAAAVRTEMRPAEASLTDAGLNPETLLALEPVKKLLQLARGRARRRSPRSGVYIVMAARALAKGSIVGPAELAARHGFHGKVTINRMGHALNALVEVGFATTGQGRYRLNEARLRLLVLAVVLVLVLVLAGA